MGGEWIPNSFVAASQDTWRRLSTVIRLDDWYRCVGVTLGGPGHLSLREGKERTDVPITDELLEVFQQLKTLGEGGAIVFDRSFERCWFTTVADLDPYLEYVMEIDDADCEPVKNE